MHIGYITSEYPHLEVNRSAGIATSLKNLALALTKKGVVVTIFIYGQKENKVIYDGQIKLHLIQSKSYPLFKWYFYRKHIQKLVNEIVDREVIDVIEAPDWTGITAFMTFKRPLVIRFHGSDAYFCKLEGRKQKLKNFMFEKLALQKADAYIAPTTFAGKETAEIFKLNKKKIKTIHYGLRLENFKNENPNKYQRGVILYIGTIIRKKGVMELAQIFNKVIEINPTAKLLMIGSDAPDIKTGNSSTYKLMESLFSEPAKESSSYLGKVPYIEVQSFIKSAHICVFPSFAETLGMVTIESMAMQKPVVNTSIGWAQEIIQDGVDGFLEHPSYINEYAAKINALLNDENLCAEIGQMARQKVEQVFNIHDNAAQNINFYKSILK
ncbi:glycosyltransferase family 4 protein [Hyunsoonleella pacifica]|uniref:Glycosyltransferase family 1 protein n=1 Tax=Hyunsoonleella pacifica TaxID=1080224 RepID=A0A4V6MT93_9FLAO|nr:glycosyltransferase family 4 protein [Hyunsoonleella pacifica]TBN18521.1 glycosyltransferase family 1 protein [Hyunsoonleella pacifica]GGD02489.1 glycoside hydrolase [Hyunsoonleella pacifica]